MDQRDAISIATQYAQVVKDKYGDITVILFGSYAKGNHSYDSDIDIAIVMKDFLNRQEMQLELMRLRRKVDSRIEPHPFREADFNHNHPMVNEIVTTGTVIMQRH